jgi:hypothetical protein
MEARPFFTGFERELRQQVPEALGELASGDGVTAVPKPLLESEEVPVRLDRRRA